MHYTQSEHVDTFSSLHAESFLLMSVVPSDLVISYSAKMWLAPPSPQSIINQLILISVDFYSGINSELKKTTARSTGEG